MSNLIDIAKFIHGARNGDRQSPQALLAYCKQFATVIIWGAGNLGSAVGKKLIELGVHLDCYWDMQASSLGERNGIPVVAPFTEGPEREKALVLFCIGNVAVGPNIYRQLGENGWHHVLHGNDLLQGLLCPLTNEKPPNTKICNSFDICSVCSCERLHNIVRINAAREQNIPLDQALSFDRVHFIVNNVCNLKCTHCFLYINSYPKEYKQNVDTAQLLSDIDVVMNTISSFGVVNIFGGEPFMHKGIDQVVERVLSHRNFGSVIVNTNGVAKIKPEQLICMLDPRVRLAFSNYLEVLDQKKSAVFFKNIETARNLGIEAKYQNSLPTWNMSSTLEHKGDTEAVMTQKKSDCGVRFLYVFDGKLFPCSFSLSVHDLGVADYPTDYVVLDPNKSPASLRAEIRALLERDHYQACGHCESFGSPALVAGAAEQGYSERYALPNGRQKPRKIVPIRSCQ